MRTLFISYIKKTESEIKDIWDNGLITFDANVLLNLYRYSTETREEILKLFDRLSSRIFLTHQAALEFHRNRFDEIFKQEKIYKDFISNFKKIENELQSKRHPFLSKKLSTKLNRVFNEVEQEISKNSSFYSDLLKHDSIYEELNNLFQEKIQLPFNNTEIEEIYKEGKKRFEDKIPPGFEDEVKEGNRKYGDLILWKQILDKAKKNNKPIIFVTDDNKKDWWWKFKDNDNMIIGPRHELIEEFKNIAGVGFHMYNPDKFLEFGLKYVNEVKNINAVEEIREFQENKYQFKTADLINFRNNFTQHSLHRDDESDKVNNLFEIKELLQEKITLGDYLKQLNQKILPLEQKIKALKTNDTEKENIEKELAKLKILKNTIDEIRLRLIAIDAKISMLNWKY